MAGVGGAVGSTVGDIMKNTMGQVVGGTKPAESAKINESETICPACGIKTPKGKFCLDCGTALIKKCSECNTEIPAGGKFCLECGHKI
jgi:membrane protease subunit (stomatin/prohibitin family)